MRVSMPRGDIKLVRFLVQNLDDSQVTVSFTEIYFTVKKTANDREYYFQKKLTTGGIVKLAPGDYQVRIEPEDTQNMKYGNYKFDIQITYENQVKETFVGDFVLTEEITHPENE